MRLLILWHLYTPVLTKFAVNTVTSNENFSVAFLSLFVLRLQGGAPSYGVKVCINVIDHETEHRTGSQIKIMVGAESFRPCVVSA